MKITPPTALLLTLALTFAGCASAAPPVALPPANPASWNLTANQPANDWRNSYPVGNGSLGAMGLGAFPKETLYLNHDTIWSGRKPVPLAADSRKADMDEAFALCLKGDYAKAQGIYCRAKNKGNGISGFQGLGTLEIEHLGCPTDLKTSVKRKLDLATGETTAITTLSGNLGEVRKTMLASFPTSAWPYAWNPPQPAASIANSKPTARKVSPSEQPKATTFGLKAKPAATARSFPSASVCCPMRAAKSKQTATP